MKDNNSKSFISKIDKGYNDLKIKTIQKIANADTYNLLQEAPFLDYGYIEARIKKLKKEFSSVSNEINNLVNSYSKDELEEKTNINQLLEKKNNIVYNLVFLSSNSFENLDKSLELLKNYNIDFEKCIYGLKEYKKGNKAEAYKFLNNYYKDQETLLDHYLINKVYGLLLIETDYYEYAKPYILKAAEKRPTDVELHKSLKIIHKNLEERVENNVEENIIKLLG